MSRDLGESTPPQQNSNDLNDLRKGPATKNLPSIAMVPTTAAWHNNYFRVQ